MKESLEEAMDLKSINNNYIVNLISLSEFVNFISFSASFLPIFLMSIHYKIRKFYEEDNFITVPMTIIFCFILKFIGAMLFVHLHNAILEMVL